MTTRFRAIVDHGVLKPTVPVELEEGATVEVLIVSAPSCAPAQNAAKILAALSRLATSSGDPRTGLDHDQVIYGSELSR